MRRYRCWIVGARDASECDLEAPAGGVAEAAAKRLGVAVGSVAWARLRSPAKQQGGNERQAVAFADYQEGQATQAATLIKYRMLGKKLRMRYHWITDWGERKGPSVDTRVEAIEYAIRHKHFSNIRLIAKDAMDRIIARQIAARHPVTVIE